MAQGILILVHAAVMESGMSSGRLEDLRKIPFEQLPNLPKPQFPTIDLGIKRRDVSELE